MDLQGNKRRDRDRRDAGGDGGYRGDRVLAAE